MPEPAARTIEQLVAGEDAVVQPVAEALLQVAELRLRIELVAVHDQQPAPVGGDVHRAPPHAHRGQRQAAEAAHRTIVVAGNVDDVGARATQRMQRFDHALVRGLPMRAPMREPPQIDDVADEVKAIAAQRFEEHREFRGVAVLGSDVDVGEKGGAPRWRRKRHGSGRCGHAHADSGRGGTARSLLPLDDTRVTRLLRVRDKRAPVALVIERTHPAISLPRLRGNAMRLSKTDKARDALGAAGKTGVVDLRDRQILILADGKRTRAELIAMLGADRVPSIDRLVREGFLASTDSAPVVVPIAPAPAIAPAPTPAWRHQRNAARSPPRRCTSSTCCSCSARPPRRNCAWRSSRPAIRCCCSIACWKRSTYLVASTTPSYGERVSARFAEVVPEDALPRLPTLAA